MFASEYKDMFLSEERMWWYSSLRNLILSYTKKNVRLGGKILDAGCGAGKSIEFLSQHKFKLSGIDISDEALFYCRKRGIKSIKKASITKIPYSNKTFDGVMCIDVLGSLTAKDAKIAISELRRVLKENGVLIIQCAALESLRSQHDVVTGIKKRYTKQELKNLFRSDNWKIMKSSYRVFFLFPLVAGVKLIKKILGSNNSKTDQYTPPNFINSILAFIQNLENFLFKFIDLPIGTSVFMVVRKI